MTESSGVEARLETLERELAALKDERAIREVLSDYGYYADAGSIDEYVDLWTDDGTMDLSMGKSLIGAYPEGRRWEGKEGVREFFSDPEGAQHPAFHGQTLHMQGNNVKIEIDGDEAVAAAYSIVLHSSEEGTKVNGAGANRWRLRRVDGKWLIVERVRREIGHEEFRKTVLGA